MLVTFLLWFIIYIVANIYGCAIFYQLKIHTDFYSTYLAKLSAQWLGLLTIASLALFLSIFFPAQSGVSQVLIFSSAILFLLNGGVRKIVGLTLFPSNHSLRTWMFISAILAIAALYVSQPIFLGDSGLYHLGLIRWLSEYGVVPGIAFIHERLGFSSSWFALIAMLNVGPLFGKVGSVFGGYVIVLYLALWLNAAVVFKHKQSRLQEQLIVGISLLAFPWVWFWGAAISPSPDFAVIPIVIICLAITFTNSLPSQNKRWLIYITALFALSVKLSLIPLLVGVSVVCFLLFSWRERLIAIGVGCVGLMPLLLSNTVTSGYPLFPSNVFALHLPWSLPLHLVDETRVAVFNYAFLGPGYPAPTSMLGWLSQWMFSTRHEWVTVVLIAFNAPAYIYVRRINFPERKILDLLAVFVFCTLLFAALTAPTFRFMVHWLIILPGFALGVVLMQYNRIGKTIVLSMPYVVTVALMVSIMISPGHRQKQLYEHLRDSQGADTAFPQLHFLMPPDAPTIQTIYAEHARIIGVTDAVMQKKQASNFSYMEPEGAMCWHSPLPCGFPRQPIQLRDASIGLRAGFIPQNKSALAE